MVVDKNPENYHRDVEQAAFSPGSLVPGIEPSPDTLLQWRLFFYRDAQYYRLGGNMQQIPVNCPFMAKSWASPNFDGMMRLDANTAGRKHYYPNSFDKQEWRDDTDFTPVSVADNLMSRQSHYKHEGTLSEYDQPRELYENVMDQTQRDHLHANTAFYLDECPDIVVHKYLAQQYNISKVYVQGLITCMKSKDRVKMSEVESLAKEAPYICKKEKYRPKTSAHHFLTGRCPVDKGTVAPAP